MLDQNAASIVVVGTIGFLMAAVGAASHLYIKRKNNAETKQRETRKGAIVSLYTFANRSPETRGLLTYSLTDSDLHTLVVVSSPEDVSGLDIDNFSRLPHRHEGAESIATLIITDTDIWNVRFVHASGATVSRHYRRAGTQIAKTAEIETDVWQFWQMEQERRQTTKKTEGEPVG